VSNGFVKIRRGLEPHLLSGRLGLIELGTYLLIHLQADFETGVWIGSAPRLLAAAPRGSNLRDIQRAIQRLAKIGFIRAFQLRGQRGNYRVLINKYEPEFGALRGKRLNAVASTSWQAPVYEACADDDAEDALRTRLIQKKKKKKKAAACLLKSRVWEELRIEEPQRLPSEFRELVEGLFDTKGNMPMSEFVGICMDLWEEQRKRIPRPFVQAANVVRERERNQRPTISAPASTVICDKEAAEMGVLR